MRFGIDMGHNVDSDRGATGIRQEDDVIKEVGLELIDMLRNRGHVVVDCTPSNASSTNDSLRRRVKTANDNKVDRFISVHFNKYDGTAHGTESWYTSSAGKILAAEASKNIAALGFTNRGAKKKAGM